MIIKLELFETLLNHNATVDDLLGDVVVLLIYRVVSLYLYIRLVSMLNGHINSGILGDFIFMDCL